MKNIFFCCFLVLLVGCQTTKSKKDSLKSEDKKEVKINFIDLKGDIVQLSDFEGKRVLVNFWATWCGPCIKEMPALLRAEQLLKESNFVFLLVSDESMEEISAFKKNTSYEFNFLKLNGSIESLGVYALPTTFIYDEKGNKVKEIVGAATWDSKEMITTLKEI